MVESESGAKIVAPMKDVNRRSAILVFRLNGGLQIMMGCLEEMFQNLARGVLSHSSEPIPHRILCLKTTTLESGAAFSPLRSSPPLPSHLAPVHPGLKMRRHLPPPPLPPRLLPLRQLLLKQPQPPQQRRTWKSESQMWSSISTTWLLLQMVNSQTSPVLATMVSS